MSAPEDLADPAALLARASAAGPLGFRLARGKGDWDGLLAALEAQPVGYGWQHIAYQHAYFAEFSQTYLRLDCIIDWQGKPVGLWPLALVGDADGNFRLSSHLNGAAGVVPPLLPASLPEKVQKGAARQWLAVVGELAAGHGAAAVAFVAPPVAGPLPPWCRQLLENGAALRPRHRAQVDLTLPEAAYHAGLRKSYKALINTARRTWTARIDETGDAAAFAGFEALHIKVAGRRTRSERSWAEQYAAIADGTAFAVYLSDADGALVGASLFNCSRDEALYAVGAYDRNLFDKPLAHLSLAEAIACARRRGNCRFILGDRPYPGDCPPPTDKELQIGFFKEGFATELVLVPYLDFPGDRLGRLAQPG